MTRIILSLVLVAACSDNKPPTQQKDGGLPSDAGIDSPTIGGPDASCFTNPTTHLEIINACTNAQKIYKDSHPPLTLPDGGLAPLP
jgi:hypothetical protein